MKAERWYIIGVPTCILIYHFVYISTKQWLIQNLAGIILFGGLSIIGRYLEKKEAEG